MASPIPDGHVGNLTAEQEAKLRELWQTVFKLYDILQEHSKKKAAAPAAPSIESPKKSRFGLFGGWKAAAEAPAAPAIPEEALKLIACDEEDKFGLVKQFQQVVATQTPESLRAMVLGSVKHEHPDALALRFLRARKWDVNRALVMMFSAMNWRHNEAKVDADIMANGEEVLVNDEEKGEVKSKALARDFMKQIRTGKSFIHGTDRQNRPISYVRVRLHRASDQSVESLERYTTYLIETARLALNPPVETATLIFDLSSFTLANMDYVPVKFIIKCFEANYPESLGAILIHNAPWVFKGIWKVISAWLDPVVAAKVHFTYGRKDLEEFIHPSQIIKELGGDEDWDYVYEEPVPGENDAMKDTAARDALQKAREDLAEQFEATTKQWIANPTGAKATELKAKRESIAAQLRENFWKLDKYVRCRSLYDRQGNIRPGQRTIWYPEAAEKNAVDTAVPGVTTIEQIENAPLAAAAQVTA
ncbi:CRAL/TRIO domain protein [Metarhizium robertsii]|uniref:Cellular retinaldehyde-binding/triple function n=2 Tax=Metarhizium robertsii TaxID=568076 RepID=E9F630_METRA|nr:Cellular retinaldehyde-binding/triple function [Metarhizium robertsii ARSEF 23]EFY96916.1 Cellular retinaldehyde-binding/triple function [Metarhizium robertsii ARSEF 23]EXU99940.1 CRAL/TRIO domain protein [Metarhizium robertsii]